MHKVIKKLASWLIRDEISEIQKNERQAGIKLGDEAGYSRGLLCFNKCGHFDKGIYSPLK